MMDSYGIHFQDRKRQANAISKLQAEWEKQTDKRLLRESKLSLIENLAVCCKKKCCTEAIDSSFLRDLRRRFLDCTTQVERKRFLLDLRDAESSTGFSVVKGNVF
jgi:hypothetical protein